MDGYFPRAAGLETVSSPLLRERTIGNAICCTGAGLHSGRPVNVTLLPAGEGSGIVFRRVDLGADIPARFDAVSDTRLCTVLAAADRPEATVGTVEHLMAALSASGICNIVVEVDGPELPILDGSAEPWLFLLDCAGSVEQDAPVVGIEVLRTVRVGEGSAFAELRPGASDCLDLNISIDFAAAAIGRQTLSLSLRGDAFREVARARTFTQAHEIAGLRAAGLALGGTLENAVVVEGGAVLNPTGLRMPDEFVRHKLLDAVGDLALAGPIRGRFVGHRSGHALNNLVLRALFADPLNWQAVRADGAGWLQNAA
ncbi:MAG: UDP-3-O-acyl-N-acetylglucosamine deacetylase [Acetobacteraceae bacterium]|nr:UDP-3-O-acyl-N-acetylglucosamine deacetylase [Acetobacteraceae bacterium]